MSRRIRLALIGAGILLVALLVFFFAINPIRGDIGELNGKIEEENARIARADQELQRADQIRQDGRSKQARMLELAKMMPVEAEIPSLILQIQDLAAKSGIDWIQISPGVPAGIEGLAYSRLSLSLSFTGSFYDVSDFIYRAEQMVAGPGRLLTVKSLILSPDIITGGGRVAYSVKLGIRMTMDAYVLPPTESGATGGSATSGGGGTGQTTTTTVKAQ